MSVTTTKINDVRANLNSGNSAAVMSAAEYMKLGNRLSTLKVTVSGLTAASSFDITTAAFYAKVTALTGIALGTNEYLPAIGSVTGLRVTAVGTAATGARFVTDVGGTASATVATLSDDGKTLAFEGTVTAFVLIYTPRAAVSLDTAQASTAP